MMISFHLKAPPLWAKCLVGSLALHSLALYVVFQNPVWLKKSWATFFSPSKPWPKQISKDENWTADTIVLQHFFEEFPAPPKKMNAQNLPQPFLKGTPFEEIGEAISIDLPTSFILKEKPLAKSEITLSSFADIEKEEITLTGISPALLSLPKTACMNPTLHSLAPSTPMINKPLQVHFIPPLSPTSPLIENVTKDIPRDASKAALQDRQGSFPITEQTPFEKPQEALLSLQTLPMGHLKTEIPLDIVSSSSLAEINDYLPEELISALEWNDDFEIQSTLFPEKDGYVFSLAVTPKQDFQKQRMKQNFYFLIDVSSEIENYKLSVFKKSVLKALGSLQQGDSFNIFLLDKTIRALNPSNLFVSPKTVTLAETFLEKKGNERSFFSTLNLYENLSELLKYVDSDDEVNTAILLTNGKSSLDPKDFRHFLEKNKGKFNLFTAAVGQNNQLTPLDMISSFCGGSLFYSDTNASFPRKLALFVKSLAAPLAKNLTLSLQASNPKATLELCSSLGQMPNLYNQEPFIIMGKMDRLCDLQLVLQGKSSEDQIFLKKIIHFEEATPPESSVKKQWLLHQKTGFYEKFLKESKPIHLKKAKDILRTVHGKAFGE